MDERDRKLLNEIQGSFPIEPHPYRVTGQKMGMDEDEVIARVEYLRQSGIIRRIGASINSRGIGYVSTLLAARVPPDKLDFFVETVNSCPGVTHNYERNHEYNLWFTLIAPSEVEKREIIKKLIEETGVDILELPAERIFKIKVDFRF